MKKYLMGLAVGLLAGCCLLLEWQLGRDSKDAKAADLPQMEEVMPQNRQQDAAQKQEQTFTVTAYCPCEKCCGAYANGYTATGEKATQGVTIAADPDVLPMGTEIELDGHTYTVQDTGGAIAGNRLDLYFDSHEDALRWGVQEKIVRWSA